MATGQSFIPRTLEKVSKPSLRALLDIKTRRFQKQRETANDNQNLKSCLGLVPGSVASFTSRAIHIQCSPVRPASYS
jgi:hypothetical protein